MRIFSGRPGLGTVIYLTVCCALGSIFTFAAVQGNYGVFRRVQIEAEHAALLAERDVLLAEVSQMENLTRRLSDSYLDLDLLDEQAREILGLVRADEIVVR